MLVTYIPPGSLVILLLDFYLYFHPADKNAKSDILFCSVDPTDLVAEIELVIDLSHILPVAPVCVCDVPPGNIFVLQHCRSWIFSWGHSSNLAGDLSVRKSSNLISHFYQLGGLLCWLAQTVHQTRALTTSLDFPLTHIAMSNWLTYFSDCMVIWLLAAMFFKMTYFIALSGLPSTVRWLPCFSTYMDYHSISSLTKVFSLH